MILNWLIFTLSCVYILLFWLKCILFWFVFILQTSFLFVFIPEFTRSHTDIFLKDITEIMPVTVPDRKADLGREHVGCPEQFFCLGDPKL